MIRRSTASSALFALTLLVGGCEGDQVSLGNPPVEIMTPFDWAPAVSLLLRGDTLYLPRLTRLDAVDSQSGSRTVAGFGYQGCPRGGSSQSGSISPNNVSGYPFFTANNGAAFFAGGYCGVWSMNLDDATKLPVLEMRTGEDGWDHLWGSQTGPSWQPSKPIVLSLDGEEPLVCLTIDRLRERLAQKERGALPDPNLLDSIELWRIARDGSPKKKLATFPPREGRCTHVLHDDTAIFVATEHTIHRLDRASETPQVIATDAGTPFGYGDYGLQGFVQDSQSLYMLRDSAIERIAKDGSSRTVLVPDSSTRYGLATDGEYVYWVEGIALYRVPTTGGSPEKIVDGNAEQRLGVLFMTAPVITTTHIWFQLVQEVTPYTVTDPQSGETLEDIKYHYALARVAR